MKSPQDRRKFNFFYPMGLGKDGATKRDSTVGSQIRLLTTVHVGQWIGDLDYGFPPFVYEQGSLNVDLESEQTAVLAATQAAFAEYVPDARILNLSLLRNPAFRRLVLDILFLDERSFQDQGRQLVNLRSEE